MRLTVRRAALSGSPPKGDNLDLRVPTRSHAWPLLALVFTVAAVTALPAASAGRVADSAASPSLVWSTWVWVENQQGQQVQRYGLWIGSIDGSRRRLLGEGRDPKLSPDGRWIAYSDSHAERTYVMSSTGGRALLVARDATPVRWSPTSRQLTIADQGRALYVFDLETKRRVLIDSGATIFGVSISPSGDDVVWGRKRGSGSVLDGGVDVFRARLDGSHRQRLTRDGTSSFPVWGPHGLAFGRVRPGADPHYPIYELWTMQPDGGGPQRVTRMSNLPVVWSADGKRLLTSTYTTSDGVVSVVDMETGTVRPVVRGQFVIPLSLSRSGRSVLAWVQSQVRKPEGDLVRVDRNGRRTTLVRNAGELADWNL
jgi:Tol biopolymer transport system component